MFQTRLLDNTNESDIAQLGFILDSFLETEKNKIQPVYVYEDSARFVQWIKISFLQQNKEDFVISARFYNSEIDQVYVAYKLEATWGKPVIENVLPFWILGLMYFKNAEWKSPADQILNLEKLVLDHFEKQKYTTGHIVLKAPKGLLNLPSSMPTSTYITEVLKKTLPGFRYDFTVEHVFRTQEDIDNFKFAAFKIILPKRIRKPVMLISLTLKYEHRMQW
jgi:hypothetical protein